MSNIENNTNDLSITTSIDGNAATGTAELSVELVNLTKQLQQLSQAAVKQANVTQSWNQAMGMSKTGVSQYAQQLNSSINVITKLSNATRIYKDVLNEARKSTEGFVQAQSLINSNKGGLDPSFVQRYNAGLVQGQSHLSSMSSSSKDLEKAMKRVALIDISKNIKRGAQAEAQSAYTLTRNFSTPIIAGLREAFFSYSKLATESNRTTKLILDNFSSLNDGTGDITKQLAAAQAFTQKLGLGLDKITQQWGASRVLVQALAGDFAELGISSEVLLENMTRLTVEAEKLGNLDMAQSSSFLQSMYQTILRIRRETGKSVNINDAVVSKDILEQLTGQLSMFNLIENKTVMSLKNISDAFPEVTAAATSFGLSMTEATSLIIPMIGAGFEVGASANSMKVSLQRMVAMTKQNTQILKQLNQELGSDFELSAGVGMEQIQKLSDAYGFLVRDVAKGGKGKQGALELFSRLFGVRQGPRMESSFAQLNAFQQQLDTTGTMEQKVAKQLQDSVNIELKAIGQKEININKFMDLSEVHRKAIATDTQGNLTAQALAVQKGQRAAQSILEKADKNNSDFISGMSTEVGKALVAQAFDTQSLAGKQYEAELKLSQNTPEVRYRRAKESIMALGRAIVPVVDSILKVLLPAFQKLSSFLQNNPAIAKLTGAFLLLAASIGPVRLAFATMKTVFGQAIAGFVFLTEKITGASYAFASLQDLMSNTDLLRGQDKVVQYLDNFLIKTRRNGKALRKEMDLTGLSQPVQEMFKNNKAAAIYGTDKAVNMKRLAPNVSETNQFLNDMKTLNIENSTQMAAKVAESSEKGIAKGAEGFSDKFAEAAARAMHKFQGPNLFAGPNYFEGNIPGTGDSGGPIGRGGRGGGSGAATTAAAAAGLTAADAMGVKAEETTLNRRVKKQINEFFLNPLGMGNIAKGGPAPVKTDGLVAATKGALAAVKGQSSSSPPRGIGIGTTGTSGVLLSTLKKIEAGLPKSMSGRIVRDVSQSYGFPLTGQGRMPYPLPSAQQIFPRSAVTSADKLKSQMSFAPKQLMPAPPPVFNPATLLANISKNRIALGKNPLGPAAMQRFMPPLPKALMPKLVTTPTLSLAALAEMFSQADVKLEAQLVHALSGPESFPVSQKAINEVKKIIKNKTGLFSLALSETGVDERLNGKLITLFSGIDYTKRTGALVQREMAPILEHLNQNITDQVNAGLKTIPEEAMMRLNEIKREITPLGLQASPIRTMKKITKAGGTTQYTPILLKDFMHALDSHFISIEDEVQGVIQVANNGLADDLMATQNLFPDVSSQGMVRHPITGQMGTGSTNIHGDMIAKMIRDVEAGRTKLIQGVDELGRETIQIVELAGKNIIQIDDTVTKYGDLTDIKEPKFAGSTFGETIKPDSAKTAKEKIDALKANASKARGASRITALQELDDYIFEQERIIVAARSIEARNLAANPYKNKDQAKEIIGKIDQKRKKIERIMKEKAGAIREGLIPMNAVELEAFDEVAVERIASVEQLIKKEQEMIDALPAANPRKKAPGIAKLAKPHKEQIKKLEAQLQNEIKQRALLLDSPAAIQADIEKELKRLPLAKPANLSDVEKLIESERKKLNSALAKTGDSELKRRSARSTTSIGLKDRIKRLYEPITVTGKKLDEDIARLTKSERTQAFFNKYLRTSPERIDTTASGLPLPRSLSSRALVPSRGDGSPLDVFKYSGSRFFNDPRFSQMNAKRIIHAESGGRFLSGAGIKDIFRRSNPVSMFKRPPAMGGTLLAGGKDIALQFADQLDASLNAVLKSSSSEVDKITTAMKKIITHNTLDKGQKTVGKKTLAFLQGAVLLPDEQINAAMQAAITDITRRFKGGTAAGLAGPGSRAQSPRSLAAFYERLRLGLSGKDAKGEKTKVVGVTEAFFGPKFRTLFNKNSGFSDAAGVENNLKVLFANVLKDSVVGLGSGEESLSDLETGRREAGSVLQPGRGRQRSTRGGVQASKKRAATKSKGVKTLVAEAVGGVNQELTDSANVLKQQINESLLSELHDETQAMKVSIVEPIGQFQQDVANSLDEGVRVITGDVKGIDVPNVDGISDTIIAQVGEAQNQIDDAVDGAVKAIPNKAKGPKPLTKAAQDKLDSARRGIDSSTRRASEILKVTTPDAIQKKAPIRIKELKELIAREEKQLADTIAAFKTTHPHRTEKEIGKYSSVKSSNQRLNAFKKDLNALEKYINQSLLIEQEKARLLDVSRAKTDILPETGTGTTGPGAPPPEGKEEKPGTGRRRWSKRRTGGTPVGGSDGDGKIFNIDKIGHRFQGPNIFSKNIFDANLKDIIPNFDDLMVTAGAAVAVGGETAGVALADGAAAVTAASVALKQSTVSKALFGNKALRGQFAEGQKKDVIESLFGSKMKKKNIIPEYVTNKLEDGTESTVLSSATRRRSLLPFGKIPIGLPIKQDLADVDKLLTKGVIPNFTRLKKILTGALGKTWLFALSGGLSVLIGPLTKVLKNFGGLKQVLSGTATAFVDAKKGIAGITAAAGQVTSNVFGGIQKAATVGLNIFAKMASAVLLIGTGLLIVVPVIGILIALYGMFKSANGRLAGAATALKEAFKALVDGAKALFVPVRDLIFVFTGADKQMGGLTSEGQKNAAFFTIISNAIKKATTAFKEWAETIGAAFVNNTVVPQITRIINKFILLGSAIKDFSSGDKTSGMSKLKAMMLSFAYDIVNIVRIITKGLINGFTYAVPVIIQVMQGLLKLLAQMVLDAMKEVANNLVVGAVRGFVGGIPGGDAVLKANDYIYNSAVGITSKSDKTPASSLENLAVPVVIPKSTGKEIEKTIEPKLTKAQQQTEGFVQSLMGILRGAGVGIDNAFLKMLGDIDKKYTDVLSSTNIKVNGINVPIVIDKKSDKNVIDQIAYIAKKSADAATSAGESLGSQINNGIKSKVAEIKDTLKGAFYSNVDTKFDDIASQYTDALEKQKEQQLKAYDDQIAAIDELAAAEERLTEQKEYETRRREIIDKRQSDHENYSVERRLAVYEGRTFDIRRLDREELASKDESNKALTDLDTSRLKTLQSFQRDLAKKAIANQKDLAEKEFDVILKTFEDFLKGVKNKSYSTQEEFAAALKTVSDKGLATSLALGTAFETNIGKLPAAIAAVKDPALAMFSGTMDALIAEASTSFGVNTGVKDPNSILGSVGLLVAGTEQGFKDAFSTTFAPLYVQPAVDAIVAITGSLSKEGDPNNIKDIWKKAGKDAFEAIAAELDRTIQWEKIFKSFDDLFIGLKPKIDKVVKLAVAAQNALANVGGQTAAPAQLDDATMKDFQQTVLSAAGGYGGGKVTFSKVELGIMATRVTEFIGSHISEGSAGILKSAAKPGSGLSTTEQGILKLALPLLKIAEGALSLTANPLGYNYDYLRPIAGAYGLGGHLPYNTGGYLKAPASQGIPALLHGGEYIINHKAVERFGKGNLERINNLKNGGNFRGFASGGYMTVPGFANGGYMTIPGFAKGGAVRRNESNKPKATDSNKINNGMKLFTNSKGQSYYVPDTKVRSGAKSGMILHPLDWQAIAVSENGQNWEDSLGKVSRTDKGVFVGALNIERSNWKRFSQGKFGNFNDPLNPPSFENQIKVAEIMYKGLASDPTAWGRAPKYLDGFEGVRLGRVSFPKLSELKVYDRVKAQGLAKGGLVRKYGSADAMDRASASPKFIGPPAPVVKPPPAPVVKPTKQGVLGKIGGFLSKSVTDVVQSFAKVGSGGLNIASALIESPLALIDKRLSFNPIKNLQNRTQDQLDNGINYIRGINKLTGLNIAGGKTGGLGQIANNKMVNMGDAFNVATTLLGPQINAGMSALGRPLARAVVGRMGLSESGMTLGEIMKPGVTLARKVGLNSLFPKYLPTKQEYVAAKAYTQGVGAKLNQYTSGYSDSEYREAYEVFRLTKKSQEYKYAAAQINNYKKMPKILDKIEKYVALSGLGEPVRRMLEYIPGIKSPNQNPLKDTSESQEYKFLSGVPYKPDFSGTYENESLRKFVKLNNLSEILAYHKYTATFVDTLPSHATVMKKAIKPAANAWAKALGLKVNVVKGPVLPVDADYKLHHTIADSYSSAKDGMGITVYPYSEDDGSSAHASALRFPDNDEYITGRPRFTTGLGVNMFGQRYGLDILDKFFTLIPGGVDSVGAKVAELIGRIPSPDFLSWTVEDPLNDATSEIGVIPMLSELTGAIFDPMGGAVQLLMHELGHVFNLDHPHEYDPEFKLRNKSIMSYEAPFSNRKLLPGDIAGVRAMLDIKSESTPINIPGFKKGGYMPKFKKGGYVNFKEGGEVLSVLHGGEYVLNAEAVKKYGLAHIEAMNKKRLNRAKPKEPDSSIMPIDPRFGKPDFSIMPIDPKFGKPDFSIMPIMPKPDPKLGEPRNWIMPIDPKFGKPDSSIMPIMPKPMPKPDPKLGEPRKWIMLIEAMNQMKFNVPSAGFSVPQSSFSGNLAGGMTTSTQNVNIYVDNFIGEPEWFNSMMKDYNTTVLPRNQKAAGLESRVISTYSGLNRGN